MGLKDNCSYSWLRMPLNLEQHGFEVRGSTYMQICGVKYCTIDVFFSSL